MIVKRIVFRCSYRDTNDRIASASLQGAMGSLSILFGQLLRGHAANARIMEVSVLSFYDVVGVVLHAASCCAFNMYVYRCLADPSCSGHSYDGRIAAKLRQSNECDSCSNNAHSDSASGTAALR